MIEIRQSQDFSDWFAGLVDKQHRARLAARIDRMSDGNFGDVRPVGEGVSEMRVHAGPGFRIYFVRRGNALVILLCGGDKSSQSKDFKRALMLARQIEDTDPWH